MNLSFPGNLNDQLLFLLNCSMGQKPYLIRRSQLRHYLDEHKLFVALPIRPRTSRDLTRDLYLLPVFYSRWAAALHWPDHQTAARAP